jgi:hypothetical protein
MYYGLKIEGPSGGGKLDWFVGIISLEFDNTQLTQKLIKKSFKQAL